MKKAFPLNRKSSWADILLLSWGTISSSIEGDDCEDEKENVDDNLCNADILLNWEQKMVNLGYS